MTRALWASLTMQKIYAVTQNIRSCINSLTHTHTHLTARPWLNCLIKQIATIIIKHKLRHFSAQRRVLNPKVNIHAQHVIVLCVTQWLFLLIWQPRRNKLIHEFHHSPTHLMQYVQNFQRKSIFPLEKVFATVTLNVISEVTSLQSLLKIQNYPLTSSKCSAIKTRHEAA